MGVIEKLFCVYLITYMGDKLLSFYIGSSSLEKMENGYRGSVSSKKYKEIFERELKENPHLFKYQILQMCETRKEALAEELYWQLQFDVVKSPDFFNMSFAKVNGYYGNGSKGKDHPSFGLRKETHEGMMKISELRTGLNKDNSEIYQKSSKTQKGRNKETHQCVSKVADQIRGRTALTHQYIADRVEKKKGRTKFSCPGLAASSEKITGRTIMSHPYLAIVAEKNNILSPDLRLEVYKRKNEGESINSIHEWLLSININICTSSLYKVYSREKQILNQQEKSK